jgi:hypothetical protein
MDAMNYFAAYGMFSRKIKMKTNSEFYFSDQLEQVLRVLRVLRVFFVYVPYARHYNPRFVYFLPTFWSQKMLFQGAFFLKFWPYVWLVFKSGF